MGELKKPQRVKGITYIQADAPSNPREGQTWYDTSTGKLAVYHGGWRFPRDPSTCWEKNPLLIRISPVEVQEIAEDGGTVTFDVYVKNVDVGACGETTFYLAVNDSNSDDFDPSELSTVEVTLAPYQEATLTLTVKDKAGTGGGSGVNSVYVTAAADGHPIGVSNTVTVRLSYAALEGCQVAAPTVTISPESGTIDTDGGVQSYLVTVTNNDTGDYCQPTTFTLEVVDSNLVDFDRSQLSQETVTVNPGESVTVVLDVRDRPLYGTTDGEPATNVTYVRAVADDHPPATSNSVVTELTGTAAVPGYGYGYVAGGYVGTSSDTSVIQRFAFPFDDGESTVTGYLTRSGEGAAGMNSTQYGYVQWSERAWGTGSEINRFAFPLDEGVATVVFNLAYGRDNPGGCNSSVHGYIFGGSADTGATRWTTIERFLFSADNGLDNLEADLALADYEIYGCNCSQAGYVSRSNHYSYLHRFLFPFDSGRTVLVGTYPSNVYSGTASFNSSVSGYGMGRNTYLCKFDFPFEGGEIVLGATAHWYAVWAAAMNSTVHGYVCGGYNGGSYFTTHVRRFAFPADSGQAYENAYLSVAGKEWAGVDATDFLEMFR